MAQLLNDLSALLNPRKQTKEDTGLTIVAVTTMTAPQTFDGSAVLVTETPTAIAGGAIAGGAVFASRTDSSGNQQAAATSGASAASTDSVASTSTTPTVVATTSNARLNGAAFGVSSATASATSAAATSASSSGLSGGAKAGIAFAVLIPLAAILIGALIFLRRKKEQQKEMGQKLDDEKTAMANAMPPSSFGGSTATPLAHAPQVSSSFTALNGPNSGSAMAAGAGAAVGAAVVTRKAAPQQSAWERPGSRNANDPANPFGNHAETVAMSNIAPAPRAREPSTGSMNIDASDFPLPGSVAPSEKAISLAAPSTETLSMPVANPAAAASTVSLNGPPSPVSTIGAPATAAAAAATGGALAGMAAAAASKRNSPPPPVDNVYRVQLDFKPSMEDELEIRAGQLVRMLHGYDDGWALCIRMDRSQQGVVPRTCLSKNTVKPRQGPPPNQRGPNSPGPRGPNFPPQGRPMTPTGRNSPAPGKYGPPQGGRPMTPNGGRNSPAPLLPAPPPPGRPRAGSSASMRGPPREQFTAYAPQGRSMSPGPYGAPGGMMPPPSRPDAASRGRSNSMGSAPPPSANIKPLSPLGSSPPGNVARKPVPGMAV